MPKALEMNVSHIEAAQARITEIHAMRSQIPELDVEAPQLGRRSLAIAGSVPPEFVEAATNSRSLAPQLLTATPVPPETVRDLMVFATAYDGVADQLEGLARYIRQRTSEAKHIARSEALATYAIAQRLATRPATRTCRPRWRPCAPLSAAGSAGRRRSRSRPRSR